MIRVKTVSALIALTLLPACNTVFNDADQALSVKDEHPIAVQQQAVTLTIAADRSLSDLSSIDKARLRAFADSYLTSGEGAITVTAPSGGPNDFFGQELAADIRNELYNHGVDWANMLGATYRVSSSSDVPEVILSYTNYVASASPCGDWSQELERRFRNMRSKNFGCAQQNNLAAMIANPKDLIEPAAVAATDAERQADVIDKYQRGAVTSSARDSSMASGTSGN
jgi:pilus assembly protein CpaD